MEDKKLDSTQATAIVPSPKNNCGVNTTADSRADRKILCRKHYAKSPAGSETF